MRPMLSPPMWTVVGNVATLLAVLLTASDARAAAMNAPIAGEIQRITIDNAADTWSGGTIVVGGQTVILPRNLLIDLPANRLTLKELYDLAPAACLAAGETGLAKADACNTSGMGGIAAVSANRTSAGNVIAGDVLVSKGSEVVTGAITYVNFAEGWFRVNGAVGSPTTGVMVRLNDPGSRHTVQSGLGCAAGSDAVNCSPDPRFTLDPDNYTNVFTTGYPLCIPSTTSRAVPDPLGTATTTSQAAADGTGDFLCPTTNRTVNGGKPVDDSRRFAPILVGDWIVVEGNFETVDGVYFLSAHTSTVGRALTTKNLPDQPDYMFLDEVEIDTAGFQNQRARMLFIGYATLEPTDILVWSIHNDPATNQPHEFPLGSTFGCDLAANGVVGVGGGECTGQGLAPGIGGGVPGAVTTIFRIRYDVDFQLAQTNGVPAKPGLSPCAHLRHEPRFGVPLACPSARADGTSNLAEELAVLTPLPREIQARTGHALANAANPALRAIDVNGAPATHGQYLFPFGINLGGVSIPEMNEINLDAFSTPLGFTGLPWTLDRRLAPGGCAAAGCEPTAQPLDPYPFEGIDPRLQADTPRGPWNDPVYTASTLSNASNRILHYVSGTLGRFDGNATLLAWPPVDPALRPIAPIAPVSLVCAVNTVPTNTPPVAGADTATTVAGLAVTVPVLANDGDSDGGTLSIAAVTQPTGGTVAIAGTAVLFTPAAGFTGNAAFTYTLVDGQGGSATGQVTVAVTAQANRPPVATADAATTAASVSVLVSVLANDTDPDGDGLALTAVGTPSSGTATIQGTQVLYAPAAGFTGTATFGYTVSDGRGGSADGTVTVTVAAERLVVSSAVFRVSTPTTGQWRIAGTSNVNGATISVFLGPTLGGTLIGTTTVVAGAWDLRVLAPPAPLPGATRSVSASSTGGSVRLNFTNVVVR